MISARRLAAATAASLLLLATGCDEPKVVAYTVPKEPGRDTVTLPAGHPAPAADAPMRASPDMAETSAGFATPTWTVPAGWRPQPASPMRKGDWKLGPADAEAQLTVTVFPGDVGGLAANANRWAQQLGLPPLSPEELKTKVSPAPVAGSPEATLTRIENAGRATLALSAPHAGATWFFKLSGPAATVAAVEPEFRAFLAGVAFTDAK